MNVSFEPVMEALFSALQAAATLPFTANATASSAILANVSNFSGLFAGLPVFGPGVPRGATIASLNQGAGQVVLSDAITANGVGAAFTTGFLTASRRIQPWGQLSEQPALFLRRTGTHDQYSGELPITTLKAEVWIYSKAGENPDAVPDEALANLDQMVRAAFKPDVFGDFVRCTLGAPALIYWARVEGESAYHDGALGGQAISLIPVQVTLQPQG